MQKACNKNSSFVPRTLVATEKESVLVVVGWFEQTPSKKQLSKIPLEIWCCLFVGGVGMCQTWISMDAALEKWAGVK